MGELALTREQRASFFRGDPPTIKGPGKCPVDVGYSHAVSPKLSFTVTGIRKPQRGGWSLDYEVSDRRDRPRLLRRVPPAHDFDKDGEDRKRPPTSAEIETAAEQSAYASSQHGVIDEAGEAVDPAFQEKLTQDAQHRHVAQKRDEEAEERGKPLEERLRLVRREARSSGADLTRLEASIERRIRAAENLVRQQRAS